MDAVTDEQKLTLDSLEHRQAVFRLWVETVRDPAQANSEGLREIHVLQGAATAQYDVAAIPHGRWAVSIHCCYRCGDCRGIGIPWADFPSRDECIEFFLVTARRHFGSKLGHDASDLQKQAQAEMKRRLSDGLFGFIEPLPSTEGIRSRTHTFLVEEHDYGENEAATGP